MIRPTKQKNSQVFDEARMKDLWKDWAFIDPQGQVYDDITKNDKASK